jgi:hypothetical protein
MAFDPPILCGHLLDPIPLHACVVSPFPTTEGDHASRPGFVRPPPIDIGVAGVVSIRIRLVGGIVRYRRLDRRLVSKDQVSVHGNMLRDSYLSDERREMVNREVNPAGNHGAAPHGAVERLRRGR